MDNLSDLETKRNQKDVAKAVEEIFDAVRGKGVPIKEMDDLQFINHLTLRMCEVVERDGVTLSTQTKENILGEFKHVFHLFERRKSES